MATRKSCAKDGASQYITFLDSSFMEMLEVLKASKASWMNTDAQG